MKNGIDRACWLFIFAIVLIPLLTGMAAQQPPDSAQAITNSPHAKVTNPHGPIAIPCENCHTNTSWKPLRAIPEFKHDQTGYPLRGMHQKVRCTECHTSLIFHNVSKQCADCHADIHRRKFGANCEQCHTVKGWQVSLDAIRDHQNRFPLIGAHALADCEECHKGAATGQFKGLSTACYSCHQKDYQTPAFDHVGSNFPTTCENCHSMDSWASAVFDHLKLTGFALTGMHATLPCSDCHINNQFKATPATCYACHTPEFVATKNPNHLQLGLPHDCGSCHTTVNWLNASFNHALFANYPLTGMHLNVACAQCHINNIYAGTPTDCFSCHKADFTNANSPNHVSSGFPTTCAICHTTFGWIPSSFDHSKTAFPLTGAHITTQCALCHVNNNFTTLPTDCFSCHTKDYAGTTNPNHTTAGFPTTCETCHTTVAWTGAVFDHNKTPFPLTGAHLTIACTQCHINNIFVGTPTDCFSCHKVDFSGTTNPNHASLGLPHTCDTCHTTVNWLNASFNHTLFTSFPLTGMHLNVACVQCHINNVYAGTPTTCYACHKADFTNANSPNHISSGFPTDCTFCHSTLGWSPSTFDHSKTTFPLTGAHTTTQCALCHVNNNFTTLPTDCFSCHTKDYAGTTNPNHATAGFPTTCATCHTTVAWTGAVFDHSKTPFPLTGAHLTVACALCHINNIFVGTPTDCYSCHKVDFTGTTNPNHTTAGFPTTCATCHTTVSWLGASFNHTWFDTKHGGANNVCATCHTNSADYSVFTCTSCHTKTATDPKHSGISGYVYNSVNCYGCHRNAGG